MSNRKKIKRLRFTLVELIMAMAVFSILALVMMRFYSSAQQIWSKASQRSEMYNDAHVALDLMARELQCVIYNSDNTSLGIYPFWFQKIKDVTGPANVYYPTTTSSNFELTQLNFIASTDLKPKNATSDICEIRYSFVPAGETPIAAAQSMDGQSIGEGWLIRSCTGDDSGTTLWNFSPPLPRLGGSITTRIRDIFGDTVNTGINSSAPYQRVISGVYFLKFTCYYMDVGGVWRECYPIQYISPGVMSFGNGSNGMGATGTLPKTGSLLDGTPLPDAIRIDLFMMSPTDWREWKAKIDIGNIPAAEVIKLERMRTFSKTVFITNKLSY